MSTRSDRKSTRLNSSHRTISYAVFCLKKKTKSNEISTLVWYSPLDCPVDVCAVYHVEYTTTQQRQHDPITRMFLFIFFFFKGNGPPQNLPLFPPPPLSQ